METVSVRLDSSNFAKGLKYAKTNNGKYSAASKTWSIPATSNFLNAPGMYGWVIVGQAKTPTTAREFIAAMGNDDDLLGS